LKIPNTKRAGRVAQVVECLPSNGEALSSNPSTAKKKKDCREFQDSLSCIVKPCLRKLRKKPKSSQIRYYFISTRMTTIKRARAD
jgi:hypothetical protein